MKTRLIIGCLAACFLMAWAMLAGASEEPVVGSVKVAKGGAFVLRSGQSMAASQGLKLRQNDTLSTAADGSLGVIFRDDSTLSLGPDSELIIDEFVFSPADKELSAVNRMTKGTAVYLTGQIGKLSPESVKFETPAATIGVRGTRFVVKVEPQ